MNPPELERYLHQHIPLSAAMRVRVRVADESEIALEAPLAPNINHRASVFGGSLTTLGILAAWTWLHHFTRGLGLTPTLVIQREKMQFTAPALGDFRAVCRSPDPAARDAFLAALRRYRRARLELQSLLTADGRLVGHFHGTFVALDAPPPDFSGLPDTSGADAQS